MEAYFSPPLEAASLTMISCHLRVEDAVVLSNGMPPDHESRTSVVTCPGGVPARRRRLQSAVVQQSLGDSAPIRLRFPARHTPSLPVGDPNAAVLSTRTVCAIHEA